MYTSEGISAITNVTDPTTGGLIQINLPDQLPTLTSQGRGSWVVPILLGAVGFLFLSRGRGMRGLW